MKSSVLDLSEAFLAECTVSDSCETTDTVEREVKGVETSGESNVSSLRCKVCGINEFEDVQEQREHFKLDWHRYNIHLSLKQKTPLTREQFEQLVENQEVSSISGSETDEEDGLADRRNKEDKSFVYLKTKDGNSFKIWKCLVANPRSQEFLETDELSNGLRALSSIDKWAVVLAKGGHFAAAVFERKKSESEKGKNPALYSVIKHKTFHRYVIRAKAGGRQSTKDATSKHARSAGASLRRYNEAALEKDISETMSSWKEDLDKCTFVFTAVSVSDVRAVFGGTSPPIDRKDDRIRRIPFPTRRPTFSEVKKVSDLLTTAFDVPDDPTTSDQIEAVVSEPKQAAVMPAEIEGDAGNDTHFPQVEPEKPKISGKKKKKNKPKSKDQRRQAAIEASEKKETLEERQPDDDEVERALREVSQQMKLQEQRKKSKKPEAKPRTDIEERRDLLRRAAEQRMAQLKEASQSQRLW